jgi:hypothetical protein
VYSFDIVCVKGGYMANKRERFLRVAENRTNKIIETLRLLGNCSNKTNYEYSDEDISKIFSTIDQELRIAKLKFNSDSNKKKFKL